MPNNNGVLENTLGKNYTFFTAWNMRKRRLNLFFFSFATVAIGDYYFHTYKGFRKVLAINFFFQISFEEFESVYLCIKNEIHHH
jgi:hypothetical protein